MTGFIVPKSEARRLFEMQQMIIEETKKKLGSTTVDLINTKKALDRANSKLAELGYEQVTITDRVEDTENSVLETFDYVTSVEEQVSLNGDAIIEIYEMLGE